MPQDSIYKSALQLTRNLIQIPSESSEPVLTEGPPEAGIILFLSKLCTDNQINFFTQEALPDRHNLVVSLPKQNAPKILFLAHMDTVSAKNMPQPFKANYTGEKIFGRGACDDKGPLASLLATIIGIKNKRLNQNFDITLVCTVDEENTMAGAAQFAKKNSQKFDICIAMEPSLLQPIVKHKGAYRCRIIPSIPDTLSPSGESPQKIQDGVIDIMSDLSLFKKEAESQSDPQLGQAGITLTEIKGKNSTHKVPDMHRILVDVRMLPSQTPAQMHSKITSIIDTRGKVIPLFAGFGIDSNPADPFIKKFQTSLVRQGLSDNLTATQFPSDCSQLRDQKTCLVWGPGNPKHAHSNKEHIEASQIEKACRVLTNFLSAP